MSKGWLNDAISALDKVIAEMDEWEDDPWEEDPRLIQLSELGLVVMATLVWPVQSRSQAEMDNLGDELSEEGCPMELIFRARGPWSPREFGFSRNVCP